MSNIGSITGVVTAACYVPLAAKYPLRKLNMKKANSFLMKLHEGASASFLLIGTAHMIAELVANKGGVLLKSSGLFGLALSVWLIADCHMAKDAKAKMQPTAGTHYSSR